ncbi:hypothetical protein, partial [Paenibacillus maysiensis]|uniref:hypothetical protein n=1 Tax=Paenibacillus maysiensis TaxID=1155954 RepID=UPI003CC9213E
CGGQRILGCLCCRAQSSGRSRATPRPHACDRLAALARRRNAGGCRDGAMDERAYGDDPAGEPEWDSGSLSGLGHRVRSGDGGARRPRPDHGEAAPAVPCPCCPPGSQRGWPCASESAADGLGLAAGQT